MTVDGDAPAQPSTRDLRGVRAAARRRQADRVTEGIVPVRSR